MNPFSERDYVIEAGAALVENESGLSVLHDVSIRVRGDLIVEVREGRIPGDMARLPAPDQLFVPGFISAHTHTSVGSYTRGVMEGGAGNWEPHSVIEALSDDELEEIISYNQLELLRSGVTTTLNMDHNVRREGLAIQVAARYGVRTYPSAMIPGVERLQAIWHRALGDDKTLLESVPGTLSEIEASLQLGLKYNHAEDGRIRPQIGPHATDTHTPETLKAVLEAALQLGNGIHMHLSQRLSETERVEASWGVTPTEWLESLGLFSVPFFAAHMEGIRETDWKILAENSVFYATCPSGGGPGGKPQPWAEALYREVASGPAIDTHSNDMVEAIKMAVFHGEARTTLLGEGDNAGRRTPTIEDAVDGCTRVVADRLGRPDLGRIRLGCKADLVGIDVVSPPQGSSVMGPKPLWNLLYANGTAVRNVFTDGYPQVLNSKVTVDDEPRLKKNVASTTSSMYKELARRGHILDRR